MQIHVFQHVEFEGIGNIESWLLGKSAELGTTRFFESDWVLPGLSEIDGLVIMGGPMSVNDENIYPWLSAEKAFVRSVIDAGKPVLGICLGAQIIASACGKRVYPNPVREIGWFPVRRRADAEMPEGYFVFPSATRAFHWHGETFDLPDQAYLLASSDACTNQAFQLGRRVLGLQFHLETTPDSARQIAAHCRDELKPSATVQSEAEILSAPSSYYAEINTLMDAALHYLFLEA